MFYRHLIKKKKETDNRKKKKRTLRLHHFTQRQLSVDKIVYKSIIHIWILGKREKNNCRKLWIYITSLASFLLPEFLLTLQKHQSWLSEMSPKMFLNAIFFQGLILSPKSRNIYFFSCWWPRLAKREQKVKKYIKSSSPEDLSKLKVHLS